MVALGNFFFRTRNFIFPFAFLMVLLPGPRILGSDLVAALLLDGDHAAEVVPLEEHVD